MAPAGRERRMPASGTGMKESAMDRRLHQLESFTARGSDGGVYKVRAYEHLVRDDSVHHALERWEPTGQVEYRLDDGRRVDVHRDGAMEIAGAGVQLQVPQPQHRA
jgi:hypothetical protein